MHLEYHNLKEFYFDPITHIGGWYIPDDICDGVIDFFHSEKDNWISGSKRLDTDQNIFIDRNWKQSTELHLMTSDDGIQFYLKHLGNVLEMYKKKYPFSDIVQHYKIEAGMKIQYYGPGEGFYEWHSENDGFKTVQKRHLVFMTYLNTLENAGTEFSHQSITTPCQKGLTIIWPVAWTHTHRGVVNHVGHKYIATGGYAFG